MVQKTYSLSTANRDAFNADPEKYVPQYGGYCAFGVAMGKKLRYRPLHPGGSWNSKLYLNLNPSILEQGSADTKGYIKKSEKYWPQDQRQSPVRALTG